MVPVPASAQRSIVEVRSILDLGDRVVEDVEWAPGDYEGLAEVAQAENEPAERRVVALVVLAEHYPHRAGELVLAIACAASDARVIAAALTAYGVPIEASSPELSAARGARCVPTRAPPPPDTRLAIGGTLEPAFGYDDENALLILGLGLSVRFGVRFPNHLAILLMFGAEAQTNLGSGVRSYLGLGPALVFDVGVPFDPDAAIHIGIGNGFDYGESFRSDAGSRRVIAGVFPTVDAYVLAIVATAFSLGLHFHAAIPTDAPDLFAFTGALMVGGETL